MGTIAYANPKKILLYENISDLFSVIPANQCNHRIMPIMKPIHPPKT